jgi:hypothetical protein
MRQPDVTIVIPTRNRANLVRGAIESAIQQRGSASIEIVVVDNASSDGTPSVAKTFESEKVRYVRFENAQPMPDNWERAANCARGQWVTFLCDDDALRPDAIARMLQEAQLSQSELVVCESATYWHKTWPYPAVRGWLRVGGWGGKREVLNASLMLREVGTLRNCFHKVPRLLNSLVSRGVLERIRQKQGRLFFGTCPDFSFAVLALNEVEKYSFIDEPLLVWGKGMESIGSVVGTVHGESADEFLREFGGRRIELVLGVQIPSVYGAVAETVVTCWRQVAQTDPPLDLQILARDWWRTIVRHESRGIDTTAWQSELEEIANTVGVREMEEAERLARSDVRAEANSNSSPSGFVGKARNQARMLVSRSGRIVGKTARYNEFHHVDDGSDITTAARRLYQGRWLSVRD